MLHYFEIGSFNLILIAKKQKIMKNQSKLIIEMPRQFSKKIKKPVKLTEYEAQKLFTLAKHPLISKIGIRYPFRGTKKTGNVNTFPATSKIGWLG